MAGRVALDEAERIRRCVEGEPSAWRDLLAAHDSFVGSVIRRILARSGAPSGAADVDDAKSDFFGDLWLRRRETLGSFRGEGPFRAYLAVLSANHVRRRMGIEFREQRRVTRYADSRRESLKAAPDSTHSKRGEDAEVAVGLDACLPQERLLAQLLYTDEMDADAAARVLGISRETLYVRKHRLLGKLRAIVMKDREGKTSL
jgi:RNA polymerase sigma factor (sigma-70 family)